MIKRALFTLQMLSICAIAFTSCTKSIDEKLEDLKKEQLAFEKKIATIKNDSLRQQAKEFGGMLFWFQEIDLENQRMPKDTAYEENPFLIMDDYPSMTDLANNYLNGIIVEKDGSRGDKTELKIHHPFSLPFATKTNWGSVQFSDKTSMGIIEDRNDSLANRQVVRTNWNGEEGFDIYYPEENPSGVMPVSLTGVVETQMPKNILKFKFAHDETGDTKEQNGIKVKLVSIKGHAVTIEVVNPNKTDPAIDTDKIDLVKVMASDKTKQYLDHSGYSTGPDDLLDYYKSILNKIIENPENVKTLQDQVKKEEDKYEEKHKNTSYHRIYFKGPVEDVVVYVLDYSKVSVLKKQMAWPVYSFKSKERAYNTTEPFEPIFNIPTTSTAYDSSLSKLLGGKPELSENELSAQIKIEQSPMTRMTSAGEKENASFSFKYPAILSTFFIEDFNRYEVPKEIAFFEEKGGKEVFIPKDSIDYNNGSSVASPWIEFQSNRVEFYPAKFPEKARYAKGMIQVKLAQIKKISYPVAQLPAGIRVEGNKVIIDDAVIKNKSFIYAKNKAGKYLQRITSVSFPRANDAKISVDYYYGVPYTLEYYEQTGDKLADYHFEVNLIQEEKKKQEELKSK